MADYSSDEGFDVGGAALFWSRPENRAKFAVGQDVSVHLRASEADEPDQHLTASSWASSGSVRPGR